MKVYTIFDEDELEDDEDISDFSWDELYLFIVPDGSRPSIKSNVLWVVGHGSVATWMNLGDPSAQIMLSDVKEYCEVGELRPVAKKEFIKACFDK
jgi:hypothetical protein